MTTSYRLIEVRTSPAVCDECGRECPERHMIVAGPDGGIRKLGVTCAVKVAGIKPTNQIERIEVEATEIDRQESLDFALSWMN